MAVVLRREESDAIIPASQIPLELRGAPRLVIKNNPIQAPLRPPGAKITARSDTVYACEEPDREEVFKGTYKRRSVQLNQCGFHGVNTRPYKDLGPVELNDGQLILDGLGQSTNQKQISGTSGKDISTPPHPSSHGLPSPYKVKLRAKTPSQFPSDLANLTQAVDDGNDWLERIRRGKGLFELLKKHEAIKHNEEAELSRLQEEDIQNEWNEAEVPSHVSLTEDQEQFIKEQAINLSIEGGPSKSPLPEQPVEPSAEEDPNDWSYVYNSSPVRPTDLRLALEEITELSPADAFDTSSPLKQSMAADSAQEIEHWYRMLCVLVWVLEAMRMESPHHMTSFHKCWSRDRAAPDETSGKRAYDMNRSQLNQWEKLKREQKALKKFRGQVRASMFLNRMSPFRAATAVMGSKKVVTAQGLIEEPETSVTPEMVTKPAGLTSGQRKKASRAEEEKMMLKQKKLTPLQMENLLTLLEEELNYTKKQSRNRIKEIIKQNDEARLKNAKQEKKVWHLPPLPRLDVGAVEKEFEESEERRRMIAHEQLTAMDRDRSKALHQRFSSLKVSGNLWQDLAVMREGVQIETTSMARRKLLMNYEWFPELKSMLPEYVQHVPKCSKLLATLEEIAAYMCEVGPKRMSRRRLIQVLATRKPWELRNPDIARAVEFLTERVIYIVADDYAKWLEQHTLAFERIAKITTGIK